MTATRMVAATVLLHLFKFQIVQLFLNSELLEFLLQIHDSFFYSLLAAVSLGIFSSFWLCCLLLLLNSIDFILKCLEPILQIFNELVLIFKFLLHLINFL